jgi:HD-like signal output (HDOD) protein
VAGALDKLPSIPRAYGALMEAASRPGADLDEVVDIVASDPAMSTKVLQLVNSAFFGSASRIVSIREAVGYLGLDLLKGLAVNVHIFGMASGETVEGRSLDEVQRNAIVTARLARRLVTDPDHRDEAFTAALVRDVGRVILAIAFPERVAAVRREARSSGRPLHVVEREEFSVTHAEVGAYLIGVWGLPSAIVETVAHHHRPGAISDGPLDVLAAVHAADVLVDEAEAGEEPVAGLDLAFLERAGVVAELERWRALAAEELI